jgi:transcriptional regulator with XRE-family HTH domain
LEAVRRIRTMRGMNQVDLAKASGVAQNTISEIELGKREARPATLKKLADALGVEIVDLFEVASPLVQAPPDTQDYGAVLEEMGFPREQIASWRAQEESANEAIARELENMSAKDLLELRMSSNPALRRHYRDNTPRKDAPPRSESA